LRGEQPWADAPPVLTGRPRRPGHLCRRPGGRTRAGLADRPGHPRGRPAGEQPLSGHRIQRPASP